VKKRRLNKLKIRHTLNLKLNFGAGVFYTPEAATEHNRNGKFSVCGNKARDIKMVTSLIRKINYRTRLSWPGILNLVLGIHLWNYLLLSFIPQEFLCAELNYLTASRLQPDQCHPPTKQLSVEFIETPVGEHPALTSHHNTCGPTPGSHFTP
jgi:hypothetical protein